MLPELACIYEKLFIDTCNDEAGRWDTTLRQYDSIDQLLSETDLIIEALKNDCLVRTHDLAIFPFLLKKALLNAGFPVKGVRKISAC